MQNLPDEPAHESARHVVCHGGKAGYGYGGVLPLALPLVNFLFEEGVTFLLYVEVDNASKFFLPDLQSVDVDVVADVPEKTGWLKRFEWEGKAAHSNDLRKLCSCCSSL